MASLHISQGSFRLGKHRTLEIEQLNIRAGESWAFVGTNGSGKSSLAKAIAGELPPERGELAGDFQRVTRLSLEQLSRLVADEWQRSNTDLFSEGENDQGRLTHDIIMDSVQDETRCLELSDLLGIQPLLDRPFKFLSTGETRKTLLCQALMVAPDLLVLDEPFDGLDVLSRQNLTRLLTRLHAHVMMSPSFFAISFLLSGLLRTCICSCNFSLVL